MCVCPLQIQNFPVYHMVRGRKEKQQECYATAVEAFRTTLKLLTTSKNQGAAAWRGCGWGNLYELALPLLAVGGGSCYTLCTECLLLMYSLFSILLDGGPQRRGCRSTAAQPLSVSDRATVHLELVDTHLLLGQDKEAALVMEGAVKEFAGTKEEMR